MLPLRPLRAYFLALSLFLALAVPALADSSVYGTVDTSTGSTSTPRDTALLLPGATSPMAGAPAGGTAASEAAAPGRAGGLQPALVALILSGLGGLLLSSGLAGRRRSHTGRAAAGWSRQARSRG